MKKILLSLVVMLGILVSCVKEETYEPPAPAESKILLNEIFSKHPDPTVEGDWVELYNAGDAAVDISGYLINDSDDPTGGFAIPAGITIEAKGFYVVYQPELTVSISSSGEDVSLGKPDGTLIDYIFCPKSPADGTSFGRSIDGAGEWVENMKATPGAANSDEVVTVNGFYGLNYNNVVGEDLVYNVSVMYADGDLTELKFYYILNYDSADMWVDGVFDDDTYRVSMEIETLPSADGTYSFAISADSLMAGDIVSWYMRAKDPEGNKMYFTEGKTAEEFDGDIKENPGSWATTTHGSTIPEGTVNGFSNLSIDNATDSDVIAGVKIEYIGGDIDELKFYYIINYDAATYVEDDDRVKIEIEELPSADNNYTFTIFAADVTAADEISWYMRAKDPRGDKLYFTEGKTAEEFDGDIKEDPATWAVYTVK